jgi:tetratricopeptide (TPR) repeat protein
MRRAAHYCWSLSLLFWLFATNASAATATDDLAKLTYEAQQLIDEYYGDQAQLTRAESVLQNVLTKDPKFVPAYLQAARLALVSGFIVQVEQSFHFEGGTLEVARAMLEHAEQLEPKNPDVHVLLGHLHTVEEDLGAALRALQTAEQLQSTNPWLHNNFGEVFMQVHDLDEADRHYRMVEALGPGKTSQQRRAYIQALTRRQTVAMFKDDNEAVKRLGKLATEAAPPNDAWTWGNVANNLFIQGFFEDAIRDSRKALSIMSYGVGRQNLALALYGKWAELTAAGRLADAEKYFVEAYSLHPDLDAVVARFERSAESVIRLAPILKRRQREIQASRR